MTLEQELDQALGRVVAAEREAKLQGDLTSAAALRAFCAANEAATLAEQIGTALAWEQATKAAVLAATCASCARGYYLVRGSLPRRVRKG